MMVFLKHLVMWLVAGAAGYFLKDELPGFYDKIVFGGVFGLAWFLIYLALFQKIPLLKFGKLKWKANELGHILVLGQTRRGKTSSGFSQIINQLSRSEKNWGGLVLGVKNTEHVFYEKHLKAINRHDDLRLLRVRSLDDPESWDPPFRINLTGDPRFPWSAYSTMIVDTVKSLSGEGENPFWADTAQHIFTQGFQLLEKLGQEPTIPNLYAILTNTSRLEEMLNELAENHTDELAVRIVSDLTKKLISAEAKEQLEATEGTLRQYLGFFMQEDIHKVFCSTEPNVFIEDMDYGKIICSSIPQHYPRERSFIHTMLKQLAYYHGMMRFDKDADDSSHIKKCNRLLFVMDEAQDVITAAQTGLSDHVIADRIGGAKVTLVFAMQSSHSAESKIGREKNRNLINHFSTRFYFQLGDENEAEEAAKYVGKVKKRKVRRTYQTFDVMSKDRNIEFGWDFDLPPVTFLRLDKHQCIIVHPKREFEVMNLPPLEPDGKRSRWYKPKSIRPIHKLIKTGRAA